MLNQQPKYQTSWQGGSETDKKRQETTCIFFSGFFCEGFFHSFLVLNCKSNSECHLEKRFNYCSSFRRCFVTCAEMDNKKAVRNAINRTFSAKGGVFWNDIKDGQLSEYWMKILDEYLKRPLNLQNRKQAALHLGRQGDSNVYVINESIQVSKFII